MEMRPQASQEEHVIVHANWTLVRPDWLTSGARRRGWGAYCSGFSPGRRDSRRMTLAGDPGILLRPESRSKSPLDDGMDLGLCPPIAYNLKFVHAFRRTLEWLAHL